MRAMRGISTTVTAMITFCTDAPATATRAMARRIAGIDITPSTTRMISMSSARLIGAITPTAAPSAEDRIAAATPTPIDTRPP